MESDVHSTRFILSVPRLEKMIPDTSAGNKDLNDKDVISLSCSKQKPFDIMGATYQEGWIALSISGVSGRQEMNIQSPPGEINTSEPVSVMELKTPVVLPGHH